MGCMGMLSTLIRWHHEDPVDYRERHRNDVIEEYQGNRNPFIDRPDLVCQVFACGPEEATPVPASTCAPIRAFNYLPSVSRGATPIPPTATSLPRNTPLPSATPRRTNTPVAQPTSSPTNTPVPPPPPTATTQGAANLTISALQCEGRDEFIRITNPSGSEVSMSGWSILSVAGPQTFSLP